MDQPKQYWGAKAIMQLCAPASTPLEGFPATICFFASSEPVWSDRKAVAAVSRVRRLFCAQSSRKDDEDGRLRYARRNSGGVRRARSASSRAATSALTSTIGSRTSGLSISPL